MHYGDLSQLTSRERNALAKGAGDAAGRLDWPSCAARLEALAGLVLEREARGFFARFAADDVVMRADGTLAVSWGQSNEEQVSDERAMPTLGLVLTDVAHRALTGRPLTMHPEWPSRIPPSVRRFLDALPSRTGTADVLDLLAAVRHTPARVSLRRRLQVLAMASIPGVVVALTLAVAIADMMQLGATPEQRRLVDVLMYVQRPTKIQPSVDSLSPRNRHRYTNQRERERVSGVYLMSHHRSLLDDIAKRRALVPRSYDWHTVDSLRAAMPSVSTQDSLQAAQLVEHEWRGNPSGGSRALSMRSWPVFVLVGVTAVGVLVGIITMRRGPALQVAGLEIVTSSGERAGRVRLMLRALGNTLPALPVVPLAYGRLSWDVPTAWLMDALFLLHLLCGLAILIAIMRNPSRSPGDVLAGTYTLPA